MGIFSIFGYICVNRGIHGYVWVYVGIYISMYKLAHNGIYGYIWVYLVICGEYLSICG
jgi:hypothetical protein